MINIEGIRVLNTFVTKLPDLFAIICVLFIGLLMSYLGVWLICHDLKIEGALCLFVGIIEFSLVLYGFLVIFFNN